MTLQLGSNGNLHLAASSIFIWSSTEFFDGMPQFDSKFPGVFSTVTRGPRPSRCGIILGYLEKGAPAISIAHAFPQFPSKRYE